MEWYKRELVKYKELYLELQNELDKIDCMRKNWTYFALKPEEFLKNLPSHRNVKSEQECDTIDVDDLFPTTTEM